MKVTSVNNRIAERPGWELISANADFGFFVLTYMKTVTAETETMRTEKVSKLMVYFNQDGREIFTVEYGDAD